MTPERYQRVGQLYHAALEVAPADRAAFLIKAAGDDEELRREVESLLEAHDMAGADFAAPELEFAARLIAEQESPSLIGRSLSHYRVLSLLGAGGMGEVYLAQDTKLRREVALKILPFAWAQHRERLARFRREAQLLASLNHKNIAAIYGLEESPDVNFLVLELVDGETLADRLARSGPVPEAETLPIAQQISEALEYAHRKGVTHRDIKPANIKLTPEGAVKVLDFGLAKAFEGEEAGTEVVGLATLTDAVTQEGQILGTPAYMSPEQVRGVGAGKQTDIWAFGCVLYELLTGQPVFRGGTLSDTVAAVLEREPDWRALPSTTPQNIRTLLRRCLEKNPNRRLHDIADARIELEDTAAGSERPTAGGPPGGLAASWRLPFVGGLIAVVAVMAALWMWFRPPAPGFTEPVHMTVTLPEGVRVTRGPGFASSVALSPDGRTLVVAGTGEDGQRLYQRPLDRLEVTPLAGTEGGSTPFFSPDGAWLGFFADGRLKRMAAGGDGIAMDIAAVPGYPASGYPDGASWDPGGRIVFAFGARSPLHGVRVGSGKVELIAAFEEGEVDHSRPELLPDGRTLLFDSEGWIHVLDLVSGRRTRLVQGVAARYATTGHLILTRGTALLAAPFDPSRLELTGSIVPLVENVAGDSPAAGGGDRHFAISPNGTLAYVSAPAAYSLVFDKPDGTEQLFRDERLWFENPQYSPDGRRLAVAAARRTGEPVDVWVYDLETTSASRLTFDGGRAPVWTPDGAGVTFSNLGERRGIYLKAVDGRGEAERVVAVDEFHWLVGWTPDARTLVFGVMEGVMADQVSRSSIVAFSDGETRRVVGPGNVWGGRLSPDGRWLAYYSLESGRFEVYVTPFPEADIRWLISPDGGRDPSWAPDGTEVYYRSGDRLLAAKIDTKAGIRVLSRRVAHQPFSPPLYDDYDIHPDGRTMVLVRPVDGAQGRDVKMVLNWFEELKRKVSAGR